MEFSFLIDGDTHFQAKLQSKQCEDSTKNNKRCKHYCVIGSPYCYVHLMYKHSLRIKESTIPEAGLGLFAIDALDSKSNDIIFKKGKTIVKYSGEIIDKDELISRYSNKTAPYTIQVSKNRYEDGSVVRGVGSLANTKPNHNNATISISNGTAKLKATKNIRNGDEIFLSYGKSYKVNESGVNYKTTK